ncbi:MAG TPA: ribonuclease P protein component [Saprospiraceae bacterium]|nr:ribonuclease P protein component [Saprospiraceae bacterium]
MSTNSYTFAKVERLKSRKQIKKLFSAGNSYAVYPLRLVWLPLPEVPAGVPVQFALTVAKKRIRRATHRNRVRRRIREAWRLNKHTLYQKIADHPESFAFMIIFTGKEEEATYVNIERAMQTIIERFPKKIRARHNQNPKSQVI